MKLRSNSPSGRLVPYLLALAGLAGFASPQAARADEGAKPPLYLEKADAFAGKSPEAKVRELTDREELRELTATYAHRVAHGASIADLFPSP